MSVINIKIVKTLLVLSIFLSFYGCESNGSKAGNDSPTGDNIAVGPDDEITVINTGDMWLYQKGYSALDSSWNTLSFDDTGWLSGPTGIGYGDADDATQLSDMQGNYASIYARKKITYTGQYNLNSLTLEIDFDDGFIAYINGQEVARENMPSGPSTFDTLANNSHEAGSPSIIDLTNHIGLIQTGENVLAIEIHNSSLYSSDLSLAPKLKVNSGSGDTGGDTGGGTGGDTGGGSNSLIDFNVTTDLTALAYINDNLSGITYVANSDSFYLIQNSGGKIWEVDTNYNLIRTITFIGFGDAEDIVYLGASSEFAIVNESSKLYIGTIPATGDTTINAIDFQEITFDNYSGNEGPEGVAFDITTQTFYIVKEENPRKLFSFIRPVTSSNTTVTPSEPFDAQSIPNPRLTQDMSGVYFNDTTGRLFILSDRDHRFIDISTDGTVYGIYDFPDSSQHEGITVDGNQNVHIVSEPNFYRIYSE